MNAWFTDPEEYSRIVYDYSDQPNMLDAHFGNQIDKFEAAMTAMMDSVTEMRKANSELLAARKTLVSAGLEKSEAKELTRQIPIPQPDFETVSAKLETLLGKGSTGHIAHYLAHRFQSGQPFKRSDVIDLLHMVYAYECDLFRCDKAMASTFSSFIPLQGKLVGRFCELPEQIEHLLDKQAV